MRLDSQKNTKKWLNGEYAYEYEPTERDYNEFERMYKLGFINCLLIYSSIMILMVIVISIAFNKINSLLFNLIFWGIIFPLTQVGTWWLSIKPKYLKYKSENPESKLI